MGVGARTRVARVVAIALTLAVSAVVAAQPAGATPTPVTIGLGLDQSSIRADGRAVATLQIAVTDPESAAVPFVAVKLAAQFVSPTSYGAAHIPHSVVLDGSGDASVPVTSTRSGTLMITASISGKTYAGTASISLGTRRRSVVVFADGASSVVTCPSPGNCSDPAGLFDPIRSALGGEGFTAADLPTFSYAGGAIDPVTHDWVPKASTCADSATSYKNEVGRMASMLKKIASANPNSDISLVGLSQGGILVFQMLAAVSTLPKGSRLVSISTFDAPIGGITLSLILHLEPSGTTCWSLGGSSKAAQQLVSVWNTTAPTQGPQQGDLATVMCSVVGVSKCAAQTNEQLVATTPSVSVYTWGSSQDGVFYPPACGDPPSGTDARDSQTVTGAGGGMHAEGASPGSGCVILSHIAGVANHASDVATAIGPQQ